MMAMEIKNYISSTSLDCSGEGVSEKDTDCDDFDPFTRPGIAFFDAPSSCMRDADGDGYGDLFADGIIIQQGTDCDDSRADVNATAGEYPGDDLDQIAMDKNYVLRIQTKIHMVLQKRFLLPLRVVLIAILIHKNLAEVMTVMMDHLFIIPDWTNFLPKNSNISLMSLILFIRILPLMKPIQPFVIGS